MTCLTRRKRLCTRICKSAHSTRLSGNKDFGLPQAPNDDICTKMGRIAGFAVEMTLRETYGGVFTDEFLSVPRSLETRTKRGVSTFHTATTAAAPDLAVKPNPLKSRALSDSCAEPRKQNHERNRDAATPSVANPDIRPGPCRAEICYLHDLGSGRDGFRGVNRRPVRWTPVSPSEAAATTRDCSGYCSDYRLRWGCIR
jgi:hypothetical protein